MSEKYEKFMQKTAELADLGHAQALLGWDQETYMPARGTALRARSQGTLAGISHERLTHPDYVALVGDLQEADLDADQAVNVREVERSQRRALKIPKDLVVELRQTESLSHEAWVEARQKADFSLFAPWLKKVLELQKQVAHLVGFEGAMYNAFLDVYEPHARAEEIAPVFAQLRQRLVPLVEGIAATGKRPAKGVLDREFSISAQEVFGRKVMADMGFDLGAGRLDIAVHPFCQGLSPSDVRLTTRYSTDNLAESLFGTMHETGHGLYEQGLPAEAVGTPLCQSISLGIHESQSRLWENMIGRSRPFWQHYLPQLREHFPEQLATVDLDAFYAAINQVETSLIRVEADEVTYNLHILLRFELEMEMVEGRVEVDDLPAAWNQRMEEYLGIRPPDDAQGVLQDVHWSLGLLGYFPTYTLGNLYAAQFFARAQRDMPGLMEQVEAGELGELKSWLNGNIHALGRRLTAGKLVREVTGEALSADYFIDYLEGKFKPLYDL